MNLQKQVLRAGVQKKKAAGLAFPVRKGGGGRKRGKMDPIENILVLCDDFWHPGKSLNGAFLCWREKSFILSLFRDAKGHSDTRVHLGFSSDCKTVRGTTSTAETATRGLRRGVTEVMPKDLRAYVEAGGGFVSIHSGNTFGPDRCPDYAEFVGNRFVTHPPCCEVEVRVEKEHPSPREYGASPKGTSIMSWRISPRTQKFC